jgi:hypothetical protein
VAGACIEADDQQFIISTAGFAAEDFGDPAIDLNDDGRPDNQFAKLAQAMKSYGTDLQNDLELAIWGGELVELVDVPPRPQKTRPVVLLDGVAKDEPPVWAPTDVYSADPDVSACVVQGHRSDDSYEGDAAPGPPPPPLLVTIQSTLEPSLKFTLLVHVHHVRANFVPLSTNTTYTDIVPGFLNGSIKLSDLQTMLRSYAQYLDNFVNGPPTSPQMAASQQVFLQLFDSDVKDAPPCTNSDGTLGQAGDHHIAECEVLDRPLIKAALVPDLQVYAADGTYVPNQKALHPDSLSFALWFAGNPCVIQ